MESNYKHVTLFTKLAIYFTSLSDNIANVSDTCYVTIIIH